MLTRILAILLTAYLFTGPRFVSERVDQIITASWLLAVFLAFAWDSRAGRFGSRPTWHVLVAGGVVLLTIQGVAWFVPQQVAQPVLIAVVIVGLAVAGLRRMQARQTR